MSSYSLKPLKLGVEVRGVDLKQDVSPEVLEKIKADIAEHRLLVFKDQGIIDGKRQIEITRWFGEITSTFYRTILLQVDLELPPMYTNPHSLSMLHPKSPDLDVFRISNDENEGCCHAGRTGWHIDGSMHKAPYAYSLYHIISVPRIGNTVFAPLTELIEGADCAKRREWEKLWVCADRKDGIFHPLLYSHPITKKKVMCFHLGLLEAYALDYGTPHQRLTSYDETYDISTEIYREFVKNNKAIQFSYKWEAGDFIISDNLALGHIASKETQYPVEEVGLRVMHRTTVAGTAVPTKLYSLEDALKCTCGKCED